MKTSDKIIFNRLFLQGVVKTTQTYTADQKSSGPITQKSNIASQPTRVAEVMKLINRRGLMIKSTSRGLKWVKKRPASGLSRAARLNRVNSHLGTHLQDQARGTGNEIYEKEQGKFKL
jgi:hypothetical protein